MYNSEAETIDLNADSPVTTRRTGLSLRLNFSWTLAGNVVHSCCQWGMLIVIARLGTPQAVGRFALGFAITAPVVMFTNLQLRAALATDAKREFDFTDYLTLRLITAAIAMLVTTIIGFGSGYSIEVAMVVLAVGLTKTFESISDIHYGLLQQHERMDRVAKSLLIRGPLCLLSLTLFYYLTRSVFWGVVGLASAAGSTLVFYDLKSSSVIAKMYQAADNPVLSETPSSRLSWNKQVLVKLALLCLPLGFVMMLISLNVNIPRYFIESYLGEADLGIFSAMTALMIAGTTVISALAQSSIPRLARYYAEGSSSSFVRLLTKLVGIGAAIGVLGILIVAFAGKWLLGILYGSVYAEYYRVFFWIAIAAAISYVQWFLGNGMTSARRFRIQVPLLLSVTSIAAVSCFWLVPLYGLYGAAYALVITNVFFVFGTLWVVINAVNELKKLGRGKS